MENYAEWASIGSSFAIFLMGIGNITLTFLIFRFINRLSESFAKPGDIEPPAKKVVVPGRGIFKVVRAKKPKTWTEEELWQREMDDKRRR